MFLNFFGLPRSAPLVGGLVLALLVLPTIIIASRAALKAVPPSIKEAALGVGASHQQAVFHHVLPLAMPGIMTGTIIGMAHALGETAPLLMIGMVAFIVDVPQALTDAATVLPVQVYLWSDLPEPAFKSQDGGRHHRAAGVPVRDERPGDLPAKEIRAPLVMRRPRRACHGCARELSTRRKHQEPPAAAAAPKVVARDVNVYYGEKHALKDVNVDIPERSVMAFIGPSGCGKSTFLRCINRMNDTIPSCRVTGKIAIDNSDIYDRSLDVVQLQGPRRHGVPEAEPVPQVDLRERGLRAAHPWTGQGQGRAGRGRYLEPEAGGAVRGGEGPAA